jgi:hypothetical protein
MRKEIADHLDTLKKSITEIALSGVDNREELLSKSIDQFHTALDPILPQDREPLDDGLEPIAAFADLLEKASDSVALVKTDVAPEAGELMDRFIDVGVTVLRGLVNATGSVIETEQELDKAEKAGQVVEIKTLDGEGYLVKSDLPEQFHQFFTDPVDLLSEYAQLGRQFSNQAIALADDLNKAELLPEGIAEAFPELFEVQVDGERLGKAFPPPKKKNPFGASPPAGPGDDENVGDGADPDAANDPGDGADDGDGDMDEPDVTDDTPQNPVEMMVRLASIIVVVGGSMLQAQGGDQPGMDADANDQSDVSGMPDDEPRNAGLMRQEPVGSLQKFEPTMDSILSGRVAVHPTVADALEEGITLRKRNDDMTKQLTDTQAQLATLQATVDRLSRQPEPPKGALFTVNKSAETVLPGVANSAAEAERIAQMAQTDPELASKQLLKGIHAGGGVPLIPAG